MKSRHLTPLLPALVFAQTPYYLRSNANSEAPYYNTSAFLAAAAAPSATHDVSFDRSNGAGSGNWTWTLSITDMQVPEGLPQSEEQTGLQLDPVAPDARVAYSSYQFSWLSDGNIDQAVSDEDSRTMSPGQSCYFEINIVFPQNVSDAWHSSSSSCNSAIGDACADLITLNLPSIGVRECQSSSFPLLRSRQASECASSFGAVSDPFGLAVNTYALGNNTMSEDSTESGETYAWTLSDIYSPQNKTTFVAEENRLHMIALTGPFGAQLVCNRVGPGMVSEENSSEEEAENGEMGAGGAESENSDTSAGNSVSRCSLLTTMAALLATTLLIQY